MGGRGGGGREGGWEGGGQGHTHTERERERERERELVTAICGGTEGTDDVGQNAFYSTETV